MPLHKMPPPSPVLIISFFIFPFFSINKFLTSLHTLGFHYYGVFVVDFRCLRSSIKLNCVNLSTGLMQFSRFFRFVLVLCPFVIFGLLHKDEWIPLCFRFLKLSFFEIRHVLFREITFFTEANLSQKITF